MKDNKLAVVWLAGAGLLYWMMQRPNDLEVAPLPQNPLLPPGTPPGEYVDPSEGGEPVVDPLLPPTSRDAQATPTQDARAWIRAVYLAARDAVADAIPGSEPYDPRVLQGALAIAALASEISAKGAQEIEHNPLRLPPDSATALRGTLAGYPAGIERYDATDVGALEGATRLMRGRYLTAMQSLWADERADLAEPIRDYASALATMGVGPVGLVGVLAPDARLRAWGQSVVNSANQLIDLLGPDLTR